MLGNVQICGIGSDGGESKVGESMREVDTCLSSLPCECYMEDREEGHCSNTEIFWCLWEASRPEEADLLPEDWGMLGKTREGKLCTHQCLQTHVSMYTNRQISKSGTSACMLWLERNKTKHSPSEELIHLQVSLQNHLIHIICRLHVTTKCC